MRLAHRAADPDEESCGGREQTTTLDCEGLGTVTDTQPVVQGGARCCLTAGGTSAVAAWLRDGTVRPWVFLAVAVPRGMTCAPRHRTWWLR